MMNLFLEQLLSTLQTSPSSVEFEEVIETIDACYDYTPSRFSNGLSSPVVNEAGTNEGSCRIFAFAQINNLSEDATLHCFGDYYRNDVLRKPDGDDHANIRAFMRDGWSGITFDQPALTIKD